jgi:hypothetical protein
MRSRLEYFIEWDPVSILFGVHHWIVGRWMTFLLQCTLGLGGVVCLAVYDHEFGVYEARCCRGQGGLCNSEWWRTMVNEGTDECGYEESPLVVRLAWMCGLGGVCGAVLVHIVSHSWYRETLDAHLEEDEDGGFVVNCMQMLPVVGWMCGLPEFFVGSWIIWGVRLLMFVGSIVGSTTFAGYWMANMRWYCYAAFTPHNAQYGLLTNGMCDESFDYLSMNTSAVSWKDVETIGLSSDGTVFDNVWFWTKVWLYVALGTTGVWLFLVLGRFRGIWCGSYEIFWRLTRHYKRAATASDAVSSESDESSAEDSDAEGRR